MISNLPQNPISPWYFRNPVFLKYIRFITILNFNTYLYLIIIFNEQEFPPKTYGVIFDGMNTIYSSVELKLGQGVSGNFEIVEEPDIDANKKIPVKYTIKRRNEGMYYYYYLFAH